MNEQPNQSEQKEQPTGSQNKATSLRTIWLFALAILIAIAVFYFTSQKVNHNETKSNNGNANPVSLNEMFTEEDINAAGRTTIKRISITAKQWKFQPETIVVKKGNKVQLKIASVDVTHGFSLPAFSINETLEPGKTVKIEFIADKKGTYSFFCNVFCGQGHEDMKGTLIVN